MNIKEHIDAGHYPKDEKGRALVPMRCGRTATILATDLPFGHFRIIGHIGDSVTQWMPCGHQYSDERERPADLLPPPPRKVKSMATLCIPMRDGKRDIHRVTEVLLGDCTENGGYNKEWKYVLLTGEYEEPWS